MTRIDLPGTTALFGPLSVDRYLDSGEALPGGGILNVAYHLHELGVPFRLLSRVGDDHPELFLAFLRRHRIDHLDSLVGAGRSASIDIVIGADRQPHMDHFVEGVWTDLRLTPAETALVAGSARVHAVMVDPVATEVHRLGELGLLANPVVSADFLSFRHYDLDRFARSMAHVDVGFVGWPGDPDDPLLEGIASVAFGLGRLVVITMGARPVHVYDGRDGPRRLVVPVDAIEVVGTTVGCGDAFIAACLARWWVGADIADAVGQAAPYAARVTRWVRPLPDAAYGTG